MRRWIDVRDASWTPAAVDADQVAELFTMNPGEMLLGMAVKPTVQSGGTTNSTVIIGDGTDPNGCFEIGELDLEAMVVDTWVNGRGAFFQGGRYYTVTDTIDVTYVNNTEGVIKPAFDARIWVIRLP